MTISGDSEPKQRMGVFFGPFLLQHKGTACDSCLRARNNLLETELKWLI